jgi:antitoxin MazE
LKEGDDIEIEVADPQRLVVRRPSDRAREALARLRTYRGRMPADFKFDRLEANERGT